MKSVEKAASHYASAVMKLAALDKAIADQERESIVLRRRHNEAVDAVEDAHAEMIKLTGLTRLQLQVSFL